MKENLPTNWKRMQKDIEQPDKNEAKDTILG